MSDLWITASLDVDKETQENLISAARIACVEQFGFVSQAASKQEFDDRLSLVAEHVGNTINRIVASDISHFPIVHAGVLQSWEDDFNVILARKREAAVVHTAPGGGIHAPYDVKKRGDKWVVVNSLGEVKGTHPSEKAARQQQKALYRNVPGAREKAAARRSVVSGVSQGYFYGMTDGEWYGFLAHLDQTTIPFGWTIEDTWNEYVSDQPSNEDGDYVLPESRLHFSGQYKDFLYWMAEQMPSEYNTDSTFNELFDLFEEGQEEDDEEDEDDDYHTGSIRRSSKRTGSPKRLAVVGEYPEDQPLVENDGYIKADGRWFQWSWKYDDFWEEPKLGVAVNIYIYSANGEMIDSRDEVTLSNDPASFCRGIAMQMVEQLVGGKTASRRTAAPKSASRSVTAYDDDPESTHFGVFPQRCPNCGEMGVVEYVSADSQGNETGRYAGTPHCDLCGYPYGDYQKTSSLTKQAWNPTIPQIKNSQAPVPPTVGARECDTNELKRQIGNMNIAAISGGRILPVFAGDTKVGISMPVSSGYSVNVVLDGNDTYIVQRVLNGRVVGQQDNVYMDEVGEAAYQASSYKSNEFGGHSPRMGSRKTAEINWKYQNDYGFYANPVDFAYGIWARIDDTQGGFLLTIAAADGGEYMPDTVLYTKAFPKIREAAAAAQAWLTDHMRAKMTAFLRTSALVWEPGYEEPGESEQSEVAYIDNEWGDSLHVFWDVYDQSWSWSFAQRGPSVTKSRGGTASSKEEAKAKAEQAYRAAGGSLDLDGSVWNRNASRKTAGFWEEIAAQLQDARSAKSAKEVLEIFPNVDPSMSNAPGFFAGSGGDESLADALYAAGWKHVKGDSIYYVMQAPNGDKITYIEGDIYEGDQMGAEASRKTASKSAYEVADAIRAKFPFGHDPSQMSEGRALDMIGKMVYGMDFSQYLQLLDMADGEPWGYLVTNWDETRRSPNSHFTSQGKRNSAPRRTASGAFPNPGSRIYYNEEGEPLYWEDEEYDPDPYDEYLRETYESEQGGSRTAGGIFPGAHSEVYYNDAGEPLGWDDGGYEPDPYDGYDREMSEGGDQADADWEDGLYAGEEDATEKTFRLHMTGQDFDHEWHGDVSWDWAKGYFEGWQNNGGNPAPVAALRDKMRRFSHRIAKVVAPTGWVAVGGEYDPVVGRGIGYQEFGYATEISNGTFTLYVTDKQGNVLDEHSYEVDDESEHDRIDFEETVRDQAEWMAEKFLRKNASRTAQNAPELFSGMDGNGDFSFTDWEDRAFYEAPETSNIGWVDDSELGMDDLSYELSKDAGRDRAAQKNPCWDGYEMIGMKEKDGRMVPNCVPSKKSSRRTAGENPFAKKDDNQDESSSEVDSAEQSQQQPQGEQQPAAETTDPSTMKVGDKAKMTYTMADGNSGSLEVVFVREDSGVYFFNGPTGEFGIGNSNGQWNDADGNSFSFAATGGKNESDTKQVKPKEMDSQQAVNEKNDQPQKEGEGDKKDGPPWAKKSSRRIAAGRVVRVSEDGKYRLVGPDGGFYWLESPDGEGGWYQVGAVSNPNNFEVAIDNADEEMRVMMADAREEFGITGSRRIAAVDPDLAARARRAWGGRESESNPLAGQNAFVSYDGLSYRWVDDMTLRCDNDGAEIRFREGGPTGWEYAVQDGWSRVWVPLKARD